MKKFMLFLLTRLTVKVVSTFAATTDPQCPQMSSSSGPYLPSSGTLRALAIFVKFRDDTFDSPLTTGWPSNLNTLPSWAPNFLAPTTSSPYAPDGMSDYFDEMSLGQYQLIGDVYQQVYITPQDESYYSPSNSRGIGFLNREILQALDPNINYANYDNLDPFDVDGDGNKNEPDSEVDMIFIIYRTWDKTLMNRFYQGVAALNNGIGGSAEGPYFFPITLDGKTIDGGFPGSGVVQNNVYNLPVAIAIHEFGHYLFGNVHFSGIGRFGIMDGTNGTGVMSAFERIKLGWISPTTITSNQTNVAIADAVTTGAVFKINFTSSNYFLVENRQAVSYYETTSPLKTPTKGILITHVTGSSTIDVECADGRWNWKKSGSQYVYPFQTQSANPNNGEDEMNLRKKSTTNGTQTHADAGGDADDVFRLNFRPDFAPWTNPSSNNGSTFSNIAVRLKQLVGSTMYVDLLTNASPGPPQNLVITNAGQNGQHPILSWAANTEPDLASYKVYRGYQDSKLDPIIWLTNPVATVTTTTWTDGLVIIDTGAPSSVHYRLKAVDSANNYSDYSNSVSTKSFTVPKESTEQTEPTNLSAPKEFVLHQNYPNPFNPTEIRYELPNAGHLNLVIFNITGQTIRTLVDEPKLAGYHSILWDGRDHSGNEVASGIYIYRFSAHSNEAGGQAFETVKKMTLLR